MISIKDSGNNLVSLKSTLNGSNEHATHHIIDESALPDGAASETKLQSVLTALLAQATLLQTQPVGITADTVGLARETTLGTSNSTLASILAAIAALSTHVQVQPVSISTPSIALDASLQSIIARMIYPLTGGLTAVIDTSIADTTPVELVAASIGESVKLHSFVVGNEDNTVGTFVQFLNDDDSVIYTVFAGPETSQIYNVGLVMPITAAADSAVRVKCLTTSAGVQVTAVYEQN